MKAQAAALLSCLACLAATPALSATSIWQLPVDAPKRVPGDYPSRHCPWSPPAPYTQPLHLQSKYDQSDASKSTVRQLDQATTKIQNHLKTYGAGLIKALKRLQSNQSEKEIDLALACMDHWLENWARAGALLHPSANNTGKAARKWALAAIASIVLQAQALCQPRYYPSAASMGWLGRLADLVLAEHEERRSPSFAWFNNHDYWAAWAVAASGMVLDRDDLLQWADTNLRHALAQAQVAPGADYAYLPLEAGRGIRAADYSNYALVPLSLLVETSTRNGRPLSEEESLIYRKLANFAARAALDPGSLPELQGKKQAAFSSRKLVWLIPFLSRYPEENWPVKLYRHHRGEVDGYSQIGGPIKLYYPDLGPDGD
jgi:poly(beta-D-mannuronate) lyase